VTTVWSDADDQDGIRPQRITVRLLAGGVDTGKTVVLSEANNWTDSFTALNKTDPGDGHSIQYTVEEAEPITGYISISSGDAETGYTITNIHEPEMTEITGSKTWDDADDQDGVRPENITIRLLKNGTEIDSKTVGAAENWSWTFPDLPKYENGGTEINYAITEDALSGYTPDYDGYNVTNRHTPGKTSLTVAKAWDDGDNQDGIRPDSVTVKLLANDADTGKTVVLSPDNNWTDSFPDLDEYQNGQKVTYTVEEVTVTGYTTVVTGDAETGYTVTNTHEPEVTVINGTKTWDDNDNQDGARPESITIRLLANGSEIQTVTVTEEDDWSWHFEDLPKYENGGSEITYSITEDAVPDYTAVYSGYDVTNTHTPGKTSLTVTKAWDDGDNRDGLRPDSVTVKLLADGADTGKTVVLNPGNNWTDSFTELDAYQNGQQIAYTVEEVTVSGYTAVVTGDAGTGFTVTNTHESERTNISVTKLWDDQNNKAGSRPQTITIRLLADGEDTGKTLTLSADNKWQGSFTDLEQYQDGKKIVYTISEDPVSGYTTTITGDAETGFTVTNKMPTPPAPSTDRPKTGDSTRLSIYLWMLFVSGIAIGSLWLTSGKRKDR
jgi:hypothetical protein